MLNTWLRSHLVRWSWDVNPSSPFTTSHSLISLITYLCPAPISRGSICPSAHPIISPRPSTCASPADHCPGHGNHSGGHALLSCTLQSGWKIDNLAGDDNPLC